MATTSRGGREEFIGRVQMALGLPTRKQAEELVTVFISCLEVTLIYHLGEDGFSMKLNSFGKFSIRHRPAIWRKVGFTGETTRTKAKRKIRFISLGGSANLNQRRTDMDLIDEVESQEGAITIDWLASKLNVSPKLLYKMASRGSLPAFRVGSLVRLDPKTTADWLRQRMTPGKPIRFRRR